MKGCRTCIIAALALLGTFAQAQLAIQGSGDSPSPSSTAPEASAPADAGSGKDLLEFLNGDVLHGAFRSIDLKTGVQWQHPAMNEPIEVDPASVARIKLDRPNTKSTNANLGLNCRVRLTNRDELCGQLAALDEQKLQLDTWYGGILSIPRPMIDSIAPGQGQTAYVYEGPTGMEGWTVRGNLMRRVGGALINVPAAGNSWSYTNGAFLSAGNGSIGHAFNLPPKANIEFDLSWRGYLLLGVSLFSDSLETYGANSYLMQFNNNNVYLQRMSNMGNPTPFATTVVQGLAQQTKARISIRIDREQRTLALVVNGVLANKWTDQADLHKGPNLVFHQQGQGFSRISGLKITAWDGKFEDPEGAEKKTKEDFVKLINGDKISGALKGILNGKMNFKTAFAPLEVPLERIAQIELAGEKAERAPRQPGEVRLTFQDHGSICLRLDRWDSREIAASSPNLGQVKLNPSAFAEMQFNLDQKKAEAEEEAMGGLGQDEEVTEHE